jgi:hypothetical protein
MFVNRFHDFVHQLWLIGKQSDDLTGTFGAVAGRSCKSRWRPELLIKYQAQLQLFLVAEAVNRVNDVVELEHMSIIAQLGPLAKYLRITALRDNWSARQRLIDGESHPTR